MQICKAAVVVCLGVALFLAVSAPARAQYKITNLVSNQAGQARTLDPLIVNAWGLARSAKGPWWISDNFSGWSTLYTGDGTQLGLRVLIPTAGNGPTSASGGNGPGMPTGIVATPSKTEFLVQGWSSDFIFATVDGTISAWAPGLNANESTIVIDNSANKASYTGLAVSSNASGNFLYAADNNNNVIDMYDETFTFVKSFGDPSIPSNFSVFGIQDIAGKVYVTYAIPNVGAGGYVDQFKEDGTLVGTVIQGFPLNQAWGIAAAPSNFGPLSNTLLISNNTSAGTINAFDPVHGTFVGTVRDETGKALALNNLWGIAFGGGTTNNGAANELFVTAGPNNQFTGLFLSVQFPPPTPPAK